MLIKTDHFTLELTSERGSRWPVSLFLATSVFEVYANRRNERHSPDVWSGGPKEVHAHGGTFAASLAIK